MILGMMFVTEMPTVDLINLIRELGYDWGPAAVGLLLLWALIRYRWKKGHRGPKLLFNGPVLGTCAVIVIGVSLFYRHWGLPQAFAPGEIGILVAEIPGDDNRQQQNTYAHAIRQLVAETPDLADKVKVRLIERPLPSGPDAQHSASLALGNRLGATFVLRAIRVELGYQVWITVVDQPQFTREEGHLGKVAQVQLAELEQLPLPGEITLLARCALALSFHHGERHQEAAAHLRRVLDSPELPNAAPTRSYLLLALGNSLFRVPALKQALDAYERALAIDEKVYGPEHPTAAICADNIGQILKAQGDLEGALEWAKRALAIFEKVYGPEHPTVAICANNIGQILKAQGDLEGALEWTKRALAIGEKVYGPEHPTVAIRANNIGQILKAQGDLEGALEWVKRALAILEKAYGKDNPSTRTVARNLEAIKEAMK